MKSIDMSVDGSLAADGNVCLLFTAPWCGVCKMIHPKLEKIAHEIKAVAQFYELDANIPGNMETAKGYGVQALPTVVCLKGGSVVKALNGAGEITEGNIRAVYAD